MIDFLFVPELLAGCYKVRQRRSRLAQRLNVRPRVRFASSLAAALLDGLSEQPAGHFSSVGALEYRAFSAS